jgi:hypothetical protein
MDCAPRPPQAFILIREVCSRSASLNRTVTQSGKCFRSCWRIEGAKEPAPTSVPIPKFAFLCGTLVCELRNPRDTSKSMTLVRVLDLKLLHVRAENL